ncbi:MAG: hypothetical protein EXS42_05315 [Lacunisphaera sp.]|nr:hypothetical protein [Lacunisphaera sp.]
MPEKFRLPRGILWGWLICGVMDISAAFISAYIQAGRTPFLLLQGVAGALLGPATFKGGLASAALGLAMHFSVAFTVTVIFYGLSRRFPILLRWGGVPAGLVYGAGVYFFMTCGVLPLMIELKLLYLTGYVRPPPPALGLPQFFIHLFCVGLPIALAVRWFSPRSAAGLTAGPGPVTTGAR